MFGAVDLKRPVSAAQVIDEHLESLAEALGGQLNGGVLEFSVSGYQWFAYTGDWILLYDTGDVQVLSDKMFNRLYKSV